MEENYLENFKIEDYFCITAQAKDNWNRDSIVDYIFNRVGVPQINDLRLKVKFFDMIIKETRNTSISTTLQWKCTLYIRNRSNNHFLDSFSLEEVILE